MKKSHFRASDWGGGGGGGLRPQFHTVAHMIVHITAYPYLSFSIHLAIVYQLRVQYNNMACTSRHIICT
jgi:hypothetical protein